jgi:hypothetical protein
MNSKARAHVHTTESGKLVKCYHESKALLCSWQFWVGTTLSTTFSFPLEHFLYEKVWPFTSITKLLGL